MDSAPANSYDETPYTSNPYAQSHPDRLATLATLFGLRPPRVGRCRVLEIGCASGGNLIPMAVALPGSTFLGIDLSERQIANGKGTITALGLSNIELQCGDVLTVGPESGEFDYIICHGVFSWVPPAVQEKILSVCKHNLGPDGVAYVSYNTLPGWRMRGIVRDMMLYHAGDIADPMRRAAESRALLAFFSRATGTEGGPYTTFLQSELELLQTQEDSYLLHDHLEAHNNPLYFHQFMDRAAAHGLGYLGDSIIGTMVPGRFSPEVEGVLQRLSAGVVRLEQYMDFARNRMFRHTLLCHDQHAPRFDLRPEILRGFHVASPIRPAAAAREARPGFEAFDTPEGVTISSRIPVVRSALNILLEAWPRRLTFENLLSAARARPSDGIADDEPDEVALGRALLQFHTGTASAVELSTIPLDVVARPGSRPQATPLALHQAGRGFSATNLRHEAVGITAFTREVLRRLDGTRDRVTLAAELNGIIAQGGLKVQREGHAVSDPVERARIVQEGLECVLGEFARCSLLVA